MNGLGDAIEKVTEYTGVKRLVKGGANALYNAGITSSPDCGCNKRKEALNKTMPFKK